MAQSELNKKIKEKLKKLKANNMLPYGYAKKTAALVIAKALEEGKQVKCTENNVHQVIGGNSYRLDIVEALIELAEEAKEVQLLKRLDKLLENKSTNQQINK